MLKEGMQAPEFTLADKDGKLVSVSDFLGKKIVLYFYPKDNTPGCTRQACAFATAYGEFEKKKAIVIGISKDNVSSHVKFAEKYSLPFVLLSDPELQAIQAYGVWQEKKLYGKTSMGVVRTLFSSMNREKLSKSCLKSNRTPTLPMYWRCYNSIRGAEC